jgi:hypothetical protein
MMDKVNFILGEDREIRFEVTSAEEDVFAIKYATFELLLDGKLETRGACLVDEHVVHAQIQPAERSALYVLEVTCAIGNEFIKQRVKVVVS